jgi:GST-like protein
MRPHDQPVIDLYGAPTPHGSMVTIMLEECGLPYRLRPPAAVGDDPVPDPRAPAIVDHDTGLHIFGAGAILQYLGERSGRLLPVDPDGRYAVLQWLFWQLGALGPMAAQFAHFASDAPGGSAAHGYSHRRYLDECARAMAIMEQALARHEYLAGDCSIADIAGFPPAAAYQQLAQDLRAYPGVRRGLELMKHRPGVRRGMDAGTLNP